jgi:lysophospholipase L1-like esterase
MKKELKWAAIVLGTIVLATLIVGFQPLSAQNKVEALPTRVACVGDSITAITRYPSDLQSFLGPNYSVKNFGVNGSTVLLNFKPNIVIIMLGTNDDLEMLRPSNASFEEDYIKLISAFQQLESNPRIWVVEPPPIFSNSSDLSIPYFNGIIVPKIQEMANQTNLPIIDVYNAFGNHSDYFVDGVHPNSQGAALIASEVYKAINQK